MNRFKERHGWIALVSLAALVCLPMWAQAQTGAITIRGSVSEVVALSASPNLRAQDAQVTTTTDRRSLTLDLTGDGAGVQTFRLPILIRSNSNYSITSLVRSVAVSSANLTLVGATPTGRFVAPDAAAKVISISPAGWLAPGAPLTILRGPRVSLAGTLDSPGNAMEITLLVTVNPEKNAGKWHLQLTLSASPGEEL